MVYKGKKNIHNIKMGLNIVIDNRFPLEQSKECGIGILLSFFPALMKNVKKNKKQKPVLASSMILFNVKENGSNNQSQE